MVCGQVKDGGGDDDQQRREVLLVDSMITSGVLEKERDECWQHKEP